MTKSPVTAWVCSVCGYIHYGAEPPEECPVCGVSKDQFEPFIQPAPQPEAPVTEWRCKECGYIHYGSEPPEFCPVCGQPANQFEPLKTKKRTSFDSNQPRKIVIVGAGIAGVSAAEAARNANSSAEILLISSENQLPYYRLNLTRYLAGDLTADQLVLHPQDWYRQNSIQLMLNIRVLSYDLEKKELSLSDGRRIPFDALLLTVGSSPFVPPISGSDKKNVFTLRTLEDADNILAACRGGKKCVCIGGGLLGLETAGGLARKGVNVTVLENQPWLMPRQLNKSSANMLQDKINLFGIMIKTGVKIKEISGESAVNGVMLDDGITLAADVVVISAGIRPNIELAKQASLSVNQGIIVDSAMQTSVSDVYAAGDVAEYNGSLYGTWGPSQGQGSIAGMNAAGMEVEFTRITRSNSLKVLGVDLFSVGTITPSESTGKVVEHKSVNFYAAFIFEGNALCGAILLDDISLAATVKKFIDDKTNLNEILTKSPTGKEIYDYFSRTIN